MPTKKQLEEQIKKLKEENILAGAVYTDLKNMKDERDGLKEAWEREEQENEKLEEEIEKLEEESEKLAAERNKLEEENEKLKEECGAMNIVEKLNKEFDEVQTQNQNLKEEKEFWEKQYWDLMTEFKFMVCFHQYNNIPNGEGGDVNDENSPLGKLLIDLPHTSFWKDDFHDEFNEFIDNLVKNTEHKRD